MNTLVRMTKVAKVMTAVGLLSAATVASAQTVNSHYDTAQVVSTTPIFERVSVPRRECYPETVSGYEDRRVHGHHGHRGYQETQYDDRRYDRSPEVRYDDSPRVGAGTVVGAVIGGAIGRQFGNSSGGRDRGTAAGAILGAVIGSQVERDSRYAEANYDRGYERSNERNYRRAEYERVPVTRTVERCNTVTETREEIRGYNVTYRYQGRDYTTRMPYDPGSTIQVDVGVRPIRDGNRTQPAPSYNRTW
jgi:uncharacterized protein YcfJ